MVEDMRYYPQLTNVSRGTAVKCCHGIFLKKVAKKFGG